MNDAVTSVSSKIYDLSLQCLKLFRDCLAAEKALAVLQPYEERFWAWANQLKVFSKSHISLDAQLKDDKFERLRQAIYLLLEVLRDNLQLALKLSQDEALPIQEEDYDAAEKPLTSNPLKVPLSSIEASLKRLDKIVTIILQATENSLARRVLAYADQARDEGYEEHVDLVLRYRFQNALPEELRNHILTSVLHRYYRIQYERKRRIHERPRWEDHDEIVSEPAAKPEQQPLTPQQVATPDAPVIRQPQRLESQSEAPTQPLTVDADVVQEKLKEGLSAPPSYKGVDTASVSETGDALYPKAPEIKEGQSKATCPICLKEFESHTFEGMNWRAHVDADLLPYICISEDCSSKLRFFADRRSWLLHMQTEHSALWINNLSYRVWRCPLPHTTTETFSSEEELFQNHLRIAHSSLSEQRLKSIARSGSISQPRRINSCPICGDEHSPQNRQVDQHEEHDEASGSDIEQQEKQAPKTAAKPTVRFAISDDSAEHIRDTKRSSSTSKGDTDCSSADADIHKRMERYIGKHLKALAFFFARNLIEDEENADDASSARPRSMDDLISVNLSEFPDPAEPTNPASRFIDESLRAEYGKRYVTRLYLRMESRQPPVSLNLQILGREVIVESIRTRAAERFHVDDPQRMRMVVKHMRAKQSDDVNESGVEPPYSKPEVLKDIILKNDDSYAADYGLSSLDREDYEIICDLGEEPLASSTLDEDFADQEVIWSNWMALHHLPDLKQSSTEPNFPFWKPVNRGWFSKLPPDMFSAPELLNSIYSTRSSDGLQEDTEVWRGFDPYNAYMAAADILLGLELRLQRNRDWNSPVGPRMDEAFKQVHTVLQSRIKRIDGQVVLTEKVILSKHTRALQQCSYQFSEFAKVRTKIAWGGNRQIYEAKLSAIREATLFHVGLAVLDTRNAEIPANDQYFASRWEEQEQAIVRTFFEHVHLRKSSRIDQDNLSDSDEIPRISQESSPKDEYTMSVTATVIEQMYAMVQTITQPESPSLGEKDIDFIISRLYMPQQQHRVHSILPAHPQTLEWMYHEETFMQWLYEGSGVFWISGKLGSGKSTFMRSLTTSRPIKQALTTWAQEMPLQVAAAFVFGRGDSEQRSVSGMIKTLLFQLLREDYRWATALFPSASYTREHRRPEFPTSHQLRDAFRLLLTQSTVQVKVALFIDGLDELGAELFEMIEMLKLASDRPRSQVKLVVSSRPFNIILDAFARSPSLRMQDLTQNDIALYVRDRLLQHAIHVVGVEGLENIVATIVTRAAGSFLWVFLVVQSLCQGLEAGDRLSDLEHRLNELPSDLEDYIQYILNDIEERYQQDLFFMVDLMNTCEEYPYQLHLVLGSDTTQLTVQDVYYYPNFQNISGDSSMLYSGLAKSPTYDQLEQITREVRRKLQSRTKGLLEIEGSTTKTIHNFPIAYMHRTLGDFFRHAELLRRPLPDRISTARILLRTTVVRFKHFQGGYELTPLRDLFGRALVFAKFLQISHSLLVDDLKILDKLDSALDLFVETKTLPVNFWSTWIVGSAWFGDGNQLSTSELDHFDLLSFATLYGLTYYVEHKVSNIGNRPNFKGRLLKYACIPKSRYSFPDGNVSVDMATILLRAGANPNEFVDGHSVWDTLLTQQGPLGSKLWLELLRLLLVEGGAVPHTFPTMIDRRKMRPLQAYDILENAVFETDELKMEARNLQNIMRERMPTLAGASTGPEQKSLTSRVRDYFGTIGRRRQDK